MASQAPKYSVADQSIVELTDIPFSDAILVSKSGDEFPVHRIVLYHIEYFAALLRFEASKGRYNFPYSSLATQHILKWVYGFHNIWILPEPAAISTTSDLIDLILFRGTEPEFLPGFMWADLPVEMVEGLDDDNLDVFVSFLGLYDANSTTTATQHYCFTHRPNSTWVAANSATLLILVENGIVLTRNSRAGRYAIKNWTIANAVVQFIILVCCEPALISLLTKLTGSLTLPQEFNWTGICSIHLWIAKAGSNFPTHLTDNVTPITDKLVAHGHLNMAKYWLITATISKFKFLGAVATILQDYQIADPDGALVELKSRGPIVMGDRIYDMFDANEVWQWTAAWDSIICRM